MSGHLTMRKTIVVLVVLCMLSIVVIFGALHCGVFSVTSMDVVHALASVSGVAELFGVEAMDEQLLVVIGDIRLKRVLMAFIIGMGLSVSGCVFQSLLRNPLADPHILGVSSGGALGAVLAAALGVPLISASVFGVPLFSFIGSLSAMFIVYSLSKRKGFLSMYSLLLIGVIVNSFFISIVIFIETIVSSDQLASIFFWLLGSFYQSDSDLIAMMYVVIVVCVSILLFQTRNINLMTLGEAKAQQLGVSVERTKCICFIAASIMTGLSVAVSGLIGFVGLVVPHIVRLLFGPDHRLALPASALLGGIFLVIADTLARTVLLPQELPVGVVTSFIGAPFFIFLLKQKESKRIF